MTQFYKKCKSVSRAIFHRFSLPKWLLVIALLIYFIFGFHHLAKFISADEHFWLPGSGAERIEKYWKAISEQDWIDTRINDKPGITLAYTSGLAQLLVKDVDSQIIKRDNTYKIFNPQKTLEINFFYRLPIVLISGFFSLFFFWIIKRITDSEWIALFSATGILLSPVLLGMSQIVNPDSLFWIFATSSFFSFFAYLQKAERKLSILTSVFLGLALASKYVSVIFFPFFFLMMVTYYFLEYTDWQARAQEFSRRILKNSLVFLAILAGGLLIFAILMPASFVEPKVFYVGTIGFPGMEPLFWTTMLLNAILILDSAVFQSRGLRFVFEKFGPLRNFLPKVIYFILNLTFVFILINWLTRQGLLDLSDIPFNAKRSDFFSEQPFLYRFIMEFTPLVFSLTPLALFSLIYLWTKSLFQELRHNTFISIISIFYLVFCMASIEQGLLVTVRYSIILFPLSMVLTAIALTDFFAQEKNRRTRQAWLAFTTIFAVVLILQSISLLQQYVINGNWNKTFVDFIYGSKFAYVLILLSIAVVVKILYSFFPWDKLRKISQVWIFCILIAANVFSIFLISPYYFSYTNELLPKKYIINGAWGYGGYEAAQFMNGLPNANKLTLWTDVYGVCEFFVGRCIHKAKVDTTKYHINYYFRSLQSTVPLNFPHPVEKTPVWSDRIDGRSKSFLKIFKAADANTPDSIED